jgi:hypothetical protein
MRKNIVWAVVCTVLAVGLVACGGGGGGGGAASKNLFSLWKEVNTSAPLELTGGNFNTAIPILFSFAPGGEQCVCNLIVVGDQSSGAWTLSQCGYVPNSGSGDPGCSAMNATGDYTLSNNTLSICGGNSPGCDTYK